MGEAVGRTMLFRYADRNAILALQVHVENNCLLTIFLSKQAAVLCCWEVRYVVQSLPTGHYCTAQIRLGGRVQAKRY